MKCTWLSYPLVRVGCGMVVCCLGGLEPSLTQAAPPSIVNLDGDGEIMSATARDQKRPAVCFDGSNHLVVWEDSGGSSSDLVALRVDEDGDVLEPVPFTITAAAGSQLEPAVAGGWAGWLVVWADYRTGTGDIYGARVDPEGRLLDPDGIIINKGARDQRSPQVVWNGQEYLVVWSDFGTSSTSDIVGARVTADGKVIDPDGLMIAAGEYASAGPMISWGDSSYLVVWQTLRPEGEYNLYGTRVKWDTTVLDFAPLTISAVKGSEMYPSVAWSGEQWLVAWTDQRCGSSNCSDVYGTRVQPSGVVMDSKGVAFGVGSGIQRRPTVFWETDFVVVWEDLRSGNSDLWGTMVGPDGKPWEAGGMYVVASPAEQAFVRSSVGTWNTLLTWQDARSSSTTLRDIYGGRLVPLSEDNDVDGWPNGMDNCPDVFNPPQPDADGDGFGDECEPCQDLSTGGDPDNDGACNDTDNCPSVYNPAQSDGDLDGWGDSCDCAISDDSQPGQDEFCGNGF